jgi:hypothetical protein
MAQLFRQIDYRRTQIPEVRMAAPVLYAPTSGDSWNEEIRVQGRSPPQGRQERGRGARDAGVL